MKKKRFLFIFIILSVLLMSCSSNNSSSNSTSYKNFSPAYTSTYTTYTITKNSSKPLTVDEYKGIVQKNLLKLNQIGKKMNSLNYTDIGKMVKDYQKISKEVVPLYKELTTLNPPSSLQSADRKLKNGALSALEILDLTDELFNSMKNPSSYSANDLIKQMQSMQSKMESFQKKIHPMTEAVIEILAAK